jgi:hypothetical protein
MVPMLVGLLPSPSAGQHIDLGLYNHNPYEDQAGQQAGCVCPCWASPTLGRCLKSESGSDQSIIVDQQPKGLLLLHTFKRNDAAGCNARLRSMPQSNAEETCQQVNMSCVSRLSEYASGIHSPGKPLKKHAETTGGIPVLTEVGPMRWGSGVPPNRAKMTRPGHRPSQK